ncbi:hypothetical protein SDC9_159100 [bioreactor metagenome]|uniref:Flavodoxin-like fold domain-containing protein n=1 Tax=bioreactor metagenome TaxID=1076179 RepID=A0A645FE99_9ZZZZ
MNALLVIANPVSTSFSHAMAEAAKGVLLAHDYHCQVHDLYAEGFHPVQPTGESGNTTSDDALVERHCHELAIADLIREFHPNGWSQPPAIMKGWIERVFRSATAYAYPAGAGPMAGSTQEQRETWLAEVREVTRASCAPS